MSPEITSPAEAAASVATAEDARELLARPTRAKIRAVALRADRLRFTHPRHGLGVAEEAVAALGRAPVGPSIHFLVWAVYGSALRAMTRIDEAQAALMWAARLAGSDLEKIDVARRLATLRATQGRAGEARALVPAFLERARRIGGRVYGQALVDAGGILVVTGDFRAAARLNEDALRYLPANGDANHLSAVYNLCRCRLELAAGPDELEEAVRLARETEALVGDDYTRCKFLWLGAHLQQRLGDTESAVETLVALRPEIEAGGKPLDRALLLVDLAEVQLQLGEPEEARRSALDSFPLLGHFKKRPEVFQAIRAFQRAAERRELDAEVLARVRAALSAAGA